jgi:hypothetical protein
MGLQRKKIKSKAAAHTHYSKTIAKEGANKVIALCELHALWCKITNRERFKEPLSVFPVRISQCEICNSKGTCYHIPLEKVRSQHNVLKQQIRYADEFGDLDASTITELVLSEIPADNKYVMLMDDKGDLIKAINLMARNGWKCINISMTTLTLDHIVGYALMERL